MVKLLNILSVVGLVFGIIGCNSGNEQSDLARDKVFCSWNIDVNLPSSATILDPVIFSPSQVNTFNSSIGATFFDIYGKSYFLNAYFLKTGNEDIVWDIYFYLDDLPVDISSGIIGNQGQLGAQLVFDENGQLLSTLPLNIISEELILNDDIYTHSIEFLFSEFYTTQLDAPFSTTISSNYCYLDS